MPKLAGVAHRDAVRAFQRAGFRILREGKHVTMTNGTTLVVIPRHDPVNAYTMGAIVIGAGRPSMSSGSCCSGGAFMSDDQRSDSIHRKPGAVWYHGSPLRLTLLASGSTVSPVVELAKAFAHRPTTVSISIREGDAEGTRRVTIEHNGTQEGFLYRVVVASPAVDLEQHPGSRLAFGEEMLTTRVLPLELLDELPVEGSQLQEILEPLP